MTMTTNPGKGVEVVTDVNANVELAPTKRRVLSHEAAILFNKSIVARPLMTPEVSSIRVKNLEYVYRWVNKSSSNGRWYNLRRSQGFVNATTDDIDVLGGDATATNGEITAGDLILMKIRADLHDAHIKSNMLKAIAYQGMRGVFLDGGSTDVFSDQQPARASVAQEPFSRTGKAQPFIPDNPDKFIDDSISSGREKKTREIVDEMRAKQESK